MITIDPEQLATRILTDILEQRESGWSDLQIWHYLRTQLEIILLKARLPVDCQTDLPHNTHGGYMAEAQQIDETPLSFESPESSSIVGASYDPDAQQLTVTFHRKVGGKTYLYQPIPMFKWVEFLEATSKGHYFTTRIRPLCAGKLKS